MQTLSQKIWAVWRCFSPMMLALCVLLPLGGCSQNWGWYVVNPANPAGQRNLKFLIDGLYYTISLSLTAISISIIVGLLIALPGLSSRRAPRSINRVYVEMIRSIPVLVLILWVYYGLPQVAGISISVFGPGCWHWPSQIVPFRLKYSVLAFNQLTVGNMKRRRRFH